MLPHACIYSLVLYILYSYRRIGFVTGDLSSFWTIMSHHGPGNLFRTIVSHHGPGNLFPDHRESQWSGKSFPGPP